ncbi:hypothetical protein [Micromonospora humida]|uniref:hypothetical protein n=1 Tax=Micromonospora humida TaxID=2809018 RepID=UPI0034347FEE
MVDNSGGPPDSTPRQQRSGARHPAGAEHPTDPAAGPQGGNPSGAATGPDQPAAGAAEPPGASGGDTSGPLGPVDDEVDEADQRYGARVINKFYGQVHAAHATFGVTGGGMATPTLVGRLRLADITHALRFYTRPEGFADALDRLNRTHLTLLVGAEGTGRRTATFALLREMTGAGMQFTGLSPAMTLVQLAEYQFVAGRGYVVLDWLGEQRDGAVQAFDAERLSERLEQAGAFLVITTEPRATVQRALARYVVEWHCPDSLAVLDAYRARPGAVELTEQDWDRVRQRVADLSLPGEVVRLVDRLTQGVAAALDEVARNARRRVTEWFDQTTDWDELLMVAALAFAYELPERVFEEAHARLREIDQAELPRPLTSGQPAASSPVLRGRRRLDREGGIVIRQDGTTLDEGLFGRERRIVFTDPAMREHVLRELNECDYQLWRPLRVWMHELAANGNLDVRLQLALGVTLLARNRSATAEAVELLSRWSAGLAAERFTAVSIVSFMAGDDVLAPVALRIALDWTERRGANRAVTAAMALGGPLGVRYPTEAERWLWHLSTRGQRIRQVAVRSLGLLFCTTAADPDGAVALVERLHVRLCRTLERAEDLDSGGHAIAAVLEILSVEHLDRAEPMVAHLLRERPAVTGTVGALWAEVLRSLPHRGAAMDALRTTLGALAHTPEAADAVGTLGDAVREKLPPQECALLRRDLEWALRNPLGDAARYRPVVATLLSALTAPSPSRPRVPARSAQR